MLFAAANPSLFVPTVSIRSPRIGKASSSSERLSTTMTASVGVIEIENAPLRKDRCSS
jgi:hypothetical protein